jgi:hypothetical protein
VTKGSTLHLGKHSPLNNDISNNLSGIESGSLSPEGSQENIGKASSLRKLDRNRVNTNLATSALNESSEKELFL